MQASDVQVGDTIAWCGRESPGVWFHAEIDERPVRLHWWDHETVTVLGIDGEKMEP